MNQEVRQEDVIFSDLEKLCASPGYIHVIAYFCFRDNTIQSGSEISVQDLLKQYSPKRLIRTEISTLIGLLSKQPIDTLIPDSNEFQGYIEKTELLLEEIHQSMINQSFGSFDFSRIVEEEINPFESGTALREAIFYGGDSAYHFQYRELALRRYTKDDNWFIHNKGYSVEQATAVISAIARIQNDKLTSVLGNLLNLEPQEWTLLPVFTFTIDEVSTEARLDQTIAKNVVESFVSLFESCQNTFSALDDFNPTNAYPVLKLNNSDYLLFQGYGLAEAFYETPFFWFNADSDYKNLAMQNRGDFTEEFSAERLRGVFGKQRVFTNITIVGSKKIIVGEIDVLVVYGNRAIILQAKSKKLTIASRKGNDSSLKDDFKKAVQDAYEQGYSCAQLIENQTYKLLDAQGNELKLCRELKEIYVVCLVSDHYPALSFQAKQFLQYQVTDKIMAPFVMDIFLLDVMTEMLPSPLRLLSYIKRRTEYTSKVISTHEITILSYHLKQNLWFDDEYSFIQLGDDICADVDLAMMTRRDSFSGVKTPEGILTKYRDTVFGQLIRDIEKQEDIGTIELGFMLLTLGSLTINEINNGIDYLVRLHRKDGKHHDLTLSIGKGETGLTIHLNRDSLSIARPRLDDHCIRRKYSLKDKSWHGICVDPRNLRVRFGISYDFEWQQSDEMDTLIQDLSDSNFLSPKDFQKIFMESKKRKKLGRNDLCLCRSGKKFKKCCISKVNSK